MYPAPMAKQKKVQLKGEWNRDKESQFDAKTSTFTFYLRDENGKECKSCARRCCAE